MCLCGGFMRENKFQSVWQGEWLSLAPKAPIRFSSAAPKVRNISIELYDILIQVRLIVRSTAHYFSAKRKYCTVTSYKYRLPCLCSERGISFLASLFSFFISHWGFYIEQFEIIFPTLFYPRILFAMAASTNVCINFDIMYYVLARYSASIHFCF